MDSIHKETVEEAATHATDEARMVLPGIQAIIGFQLIAVFNQRFESLHFIDQAVHLGAFFLLVLAMGLLMTPAAYHRLIERGSVSNTFVGLTSALISVALLPLLIGLALDTYILVKLVSHERVTSLFAGIAVGVLLVGLWYILPICLKRGACSQQSWDKPCPPQS